MPLSDLDRARESAARLAQRGRTSGREPADTAAPTYARLAFQRGAAQPAQAPLPPPALPTLSLEEGEGHSWDVLLTWLRDSTQAHAVFVVDSDGLPVAQLGALQNEDLDALGARLSFAFEQTSRMRSTQGALDSIFVELDGAWLSGIRVTAPTGSLLFALLSAEPLSVALRDRLGSMLLQVLS